MMMKTFVFIFFGVFLFVMIGIIGYNFSTTRTHSPLEEITFNYGDLDIKVTYCRPYKKGRLIFGEERDDALVPYGKYWRLGANDATEITFSLPVYFAGTPLNAGSYRMYAVPGSESWEISLNSELGKFGAYPPDYNFDVLKVHVLVQKSDSMTEQFTIDFSNDSVRVNMTFGWDHTWVNVPIRPQ
ncbi:MAG: DUF2911 domain-containing protein [Saprospiraceae bacterium]|nr:DUF2911 domain-containing protein [Saprospiraceae bacterium]MCB9326110.1 DUF2911 domain-containing protein [Lewinellaceae bacterium]